MRTTIEKSQATERTGTSGRAARLAAVAIASALIFSACGGSDDEAVSSTTSVTEADAMAEGAMEDDAMEDGSMEDDAMAEGSMEDAMLGAFGPACSAVPADGEGSFAGMADDPAGTAASNNPVLSTLVTAVVEAGLVDTLNSDGPFTIFAPTNDAFAAVGDETLGVVLGDKDLLTSILTYHVIAGEKLDADALAAAGTATTVNGETLTFGSDGLSVNGVNAVCSNVPTANATVHIIDSVLLPETAIAALTGDAMEDDAMAEDAMLGAFGPACSAVPADGEGSFAGMADDPAGTAASNNPVLSTLVTAVVEAELVDTLNSDGPFTIFAPTNDAFAAVGDETLGVVLGDKDLLTSILTYHVIAGEKLDADALAAAGTATTVNGETLTFGSDGLTVNGVNAVCSNVPTANATVHIIDTVLLPETAIAALTGESAADAMLGASGPACSAVPTEGEGSFAGMADDPAGTAASNNPVLSTLVTAVVEADLVDTLNSDGPFTIFAPTNDAFGKIPADDLNAVLADKDLLTSILTLHVVAGEKLSADDLTTAGTVTTVNGADLTLAKSGDTLTVNGSNVVCMNVPTANATVHIIDTVILPG